MAGGVKQKGATRASSQRTSVAKDSSADIIARPRRQSGTTSSGGSISVRSPISSGGSLSPSSEDSWSDLGEDDIDPSDSASRSRGPLTRRPTVEAPRPPPARRHSSRRVHRDREREERSPPRRQSSRNHLRHESRHERRHERSSSQRVHSDGSSSTGTVADDYPPYGHHGMPRAQYPTYRHVPAGGHGGYPPTMASGPSAGYSDPYHDPRQALVATRHDAFGYPGQPNPFSQHTAPPNPFSPMTSEGSSYFAGAPEPPIAHMGPPPGPQRHPSEMDLHGRRPRPPSFPGPSPYGPPEQAIMPYQPPGFPAPFGIPYGMPGYPMYPPMHAYPPQPPTPAPKPAASPPPPPKEPEKNKDLEILKEMLTEKEKKDTQDKSAKSDEIAMLKDLIKKHEEERAAREKAWIAEREAEAAAKAAEIAKAEEEKKRKEEIADASKKAKEAAEKKAEEAAKKAAEEAEKKLSEAQKKAEETEKAKAALEEAIEKAKPTPDSQKAPIRFKDAVGRKFSFPWAICKTWKGMETLIKQAFLHVDLIGDHVHQGHYDLTGPDGEIILPQIWDSMIQPDWEVTMHLWPMEEEKKPPKEDPIVTLNDPFAGLSMGGAFDNFHMPPEPVKKAKKAKDGKKGGKKPGSPETMLMMPPPPPPGVMMPPPPPAGSGGGFGDPFAGMMPPGITAVVDKPTKEKAKARGKSVRGKEISPLAAWFAGGNINATRPKKR